MHKQFSPPLTDAERRRKQRSTPTPFRTPSARGHMGQNIPLASSSQSSLCFLPAPWALCWEQPWLCPTLLSSRCEHRCVTNVVSLLEPKQHHTGTEENNSIPGEMKTVCLVFVKCLGFILSDIWRNSFSSPLIFSVTYGKTILLQGLLPQNNRYILEAEEER